MLISIEHKWATPFGLSYSLINMYSKCGKIDVARKIFEGMHHKNVVSWNAMISGFALRGLGEEALAQFL